MSPTCEHWALNRTFDGIIAWDSFFHLSQAHQRRMFPIFKRHAASGAALMFTSGPSADDQLGAYQGEPLFTQASTVPNTANFCTTMGSAWKRMSSKIPTAAFTRSGWHDSDKRGLAARQLP